MTIRAQVTIERDTALPRDQIVNTWHFVGGTLDEAGGINIRDALADFYEGQDPSNGNRVSQYFAETIGTSATVKCYNLSDVEPRIPFYTGSFAINAGSGALPEEVAVCLSFSASMESGANAARRRGRIYLGPLGPGAAAVSGGRVFVPLVVRETIRNAAIRLLANDAPHQWAVYSQADLTGRSVVSGWIDDTHDTIRSRGTRASTRTTFSA